MKIFSIYFILAWSGWTALGQTQSTTSAPSPTPYSIVSRSANSRVWERTTYELSPSGKVVPHLHHYMELASGLCYQQNGQWLDSQEQISILPDGSAAATNGQYQAYFPVDIYNGFIRVVGRDGVQLNSRPVGLSYDDGTNTVLIAELTNSVGELISSNQILYPDAFTGISADLLYTYRKSGFEQDVVFRQQPATPEQFGLNPANTRLQLLTEFFNPPAPLETVGPVNAQDGLQDTTLAFGATEMMPGRAFLAGTTSPQNNLRRVPVYKSWATIDGRPFLIEDAPYLRISSQLATLPLTSSSSTVSFTGSTLRKASSPRFLPANRLVQASTNSIRLAKTDFKANRGLVLDYVTDASEWVTNYTFQGDTTYYLSDWFALYGTTVLEGGTVIKANDAGYLYIYSIGSVDCQTAPYRPAIFTSMNDDSVGDQIGGSSGSPNFQDVTYYLYLIPTNITIQNVRFSYCYQAIQEGSNPNWITISDCQFLNTCYPIWMCNIYLYNVLFVCSSDEASEINNEGVPELIADGNVVAENVTSDSGYGFYYPDASGQTVALTNCLITSQIMFPLGGPATLLTNDVIYLPSPSMPVYQTANGGCYYLTNSSPYRAAGTTNINPILLADLAQKTTYPPIVYNGTNFTTPMTFPPQAWRDSTNVVDLGYHYDPLDYIFINSCQAYTNLTFTTGTAAAWSTSEGIQLQAALTVSFNGIATDPDYWVRCNTVQEEDLNGDYGAAGIASLYSSSLATAPTAQATFTHFSMMSGAGNAFRDDGGCINANLQNCEFWDTGEGGYGVGMNFTNCLFFRSYINDQSDCSACDDVMMQNCTVYGRSMTMSHWSGATWPVDIVDCTFDGVDLSQVDSDSYADYNSYLTNADQLPSSGSHDIIVTNFNWETSWFGNFYLPTNSPLIEKGSTNANYLGLYHFTTQTNQVVDGTNVVTIGYHYVATDQYGNPLDSNGDGIPDYLEDTIGNGSGNWDTTLFLNVIITQPKNSDVLP